MKIVISHGVMLKIERTHRLNGSNGFGRHFNVWDPELRFCFCSPSPNWKRRKKSAARLCEGTDGIQGKQIKTGKGKTWISWTSLFETRSRICASDIHLMLEHVTDLQM